MGEELQIPTYREFNDYYKAANTPMRSMNDAFHVFRFRDLGDDIVQEMGPYSISYFQIAIGSEIKAKVDVFDLREETEAYTMVVFLPGQILSWKKTGNWDGYLVNFKESFLNLGRIGHQKESFAFLHHVNPLILSLSKKEYRLLRGVFKLMLRESRAFGEEQTMVTRNLLQVLVVYVNRIVSDRDQSGIFVVSPYQQVATRFKSLVLEHYLKEKSVTCYARMLGISSAYLADAVKKVFQTTPKCLINEMTYLYAKTLLSSTDMGIKELAWTLNFDDYSHFVKFFKKMSGLTPAAFRKGLEKKD
ncbi:MAG: AraC family transcriptional regulator [Lunatimonas sp.]|uniref:helix-turn-helix domain-containing protein n=1 Tax=Lunatimonas sp. TaxID=2060141 RepID=UPI00263B75EB|nr:helix-turn-helix domain-containing protein [Lunatimonas sp.]MCC5937685.1 AraC family transcriptional regulator [Lunatimonas sp.]